jgi:hypothetical protein
MDADDGGSIAHMLLDWVIAVGRPGGRRGGLSSGGGGWRAPSAR